MKINTKFRKYKKGDLIEVSANEQNGATLVKVLRTWYPKEGDRFTETDECKKLGYLNSKPDRMFPQLVCEVIESNNSSQLIKTEYSHGRWNLICLQGDEYNKIASLQTV